MAPWGQPGWFEARSWFAAQLPIGGNVGNANRKPKNDLETIIIPPVLTIYSTATTYLIGNIDVNIIFRRPVCHYVAPLLDGIKNVP